jgi:outer membrane protein OmpA-like peptidoglycan-associated protein
MEDWEMEGLKAASVSKQSTPASGVLQRKCSGCKKKEKEKIRLQRTAVRSGPVGDVPPIVHDVLRSPGKPLDKATREFMESRFSHDFSHVSPQAAMQTTGMVVGPQGDRYEQEADRAAEATMKPATPQKAHLHPGYDFSNVRVHDDSRAAESARAVNALAYTVEQDIVFGSGYSPNTDLGKKLLAHELAHTLQQSSSDGALRRKCGAAAMGPASPDCQIDTNARPRSNRLGEDRFLFKKNCDDFDADHESRLSEVASRIPANARVSVLGMASRDGPADFNRSLSCERAFRGAEIIIRSGHGSQIDDVRATGPIGAEGDTHLRAVEVLVTAPRQPQRQPKPKCGPDATDWFIRTINGARRDRDIVGIQRDMADADALARRYGATAADVAEGGAAAAVLAQEQKLRIFGPAPPPRNATIDAQLAAGIFRGASATARLTPRPPLPFLPADGRLIDTPRILFHINRAANNWKALVTHGARYDFKAHVMNHPRSAHCPEPGCIPIEVGTITLCPAATSENCYESDLPGNLFYARIGRHVGYSRNTLQLGSQYAELTDTRLRPARPAVTWDTPEDTFSIDLGFGLPLPLTRSDLCSIMPAVRTSLSRPATSCDDCNEVF